MTPREAAREAATRSEVDDDRPRLAASHAASAASGSYDWVAAACRTRAAIGGAASGAYQADVQRAVAHAIRGLGGRPYIPPRPEPGR